MAKDNKRLARGYRGEEMREYHPSKSEVLLEYLCASFGTELNGAYIDHRPDGPLLCRLATPTIVENKNKKFLLQFQYTKFSLLSADREKLEEIFNKNSQGKRRKSFKNIQKAIYKCAKRGEDHDTFLMVTNAALVPELRLHRFPKEIYISIYDNVDDIEPTIEPDTPSIEPFTIHNKPEFNDELPYSFLRLSIQPHFVIGQVCEPTEDIYDELMISFPKLSLDHAWHLEEANRRHKFVWDRIKRNGGNQYFFENLRIPSDMPRVATMGWIQTYLQKMTRGRSL